MHPLGGTETRASIPYEVYGQRGRPTTMTEDDSDRGWPLEDLFEAIRAAARADDGTARRSTASENGRVRVDFTVRTGLGPGAPGRKGHPAFDGQSPAESQDRPARVDTGGETPRVTVDLTGTEPTPESVSATLTGSRLRVDVDGDTVATVALDGHEDWSVRETTLNNGIYQVCLE
jgi:hypothetical protein